MPSVDPDKKIVFIEKFRSIKEIVENGGVITGDLTIDDDGAHVIDGVKIEYPTPFFNDANREWTIACTIKVNFDHDDNGQHYFWTTDATNRYEFQKWVSNTVNMRMNSSIIFTDGSVNWSDGDILKVVFVQNGNSGSLYVNSTTAVGSGSSGWTAAQASRLLLGATSSGTATDSGAYRDFRIIQGVWSAEEIQDYIDDDTYTEIQTQDAIAYLPLRTRYDNGASIVTENKLGTDALWGDGAGSLEPTMTDQGADFDGTDDVIEFQSDIIGTSACTIMALIKPNTFGENAFGRIAHNHLALVFAIDDTNDTLAFTGDDSTLAYSATNSIQLGAWQTVAVTRNAAGDETNFYINGALSGTADQDSGTPTAGSDNMFVGNRPAGDRTFDGIIAEWIAFDFVLTPTQIREWHKRLFDKLNS